MKKLLRKYYTYYFIVTLKPYLEKIIFLQLHMKQYLQKKKNVVLLEINNLYSSCIGYSYVVNFLAKKYKADIFAFKISPDISIFSRLIFFLRKILLLDILSIYASFGVISFFFFNHVNRRQVDVIFNKIIKKIKNKNDVENITINNILFEIGRAHV